MFAPTQGVFCSMNTNNFSSLWAALGTLVFVFVLFAGFSITEADEVSDAITNAVSYLNTQGSEATKTMALVAAGQSVDVAYLKSFSGSSAIEYAKPIMAIAAAGQNPSTYPNEDFVVKLKSFADSTQLGSLDQVNDDIWGILALRAAGSSVSDSVIQNSKNFILLNQNSDGGWSWNVGGSSDTNDTAGAIMALLETGMTKDDSAIQNAISYLKSAQNDDGGFPYDPVSSFGTDSDGNSDAWVIAAANKLGEDPKSWTKSGNNAVDHLLSLQGTDGGFWWMEPPADFNNKAPTADAVIALTGNSFPVASSVPTNGSGTSEAYYRIVGSTGEICRGAVEAATALDVVINAADDCGYTYEIQEFSFGLFLSRIGEDSAEGTKGWLYTVNEELPNIGAADYALSGEEKVLWYYGEFDDDPPVLGETSDSVDLSVEIMGNDSDDSSGGSVPEVGFSVTPSALNLGQLIPGNSVFDQVMLKNEGQKNLTIKVDVAGNTVFNFLKIDGSLWNLFTMFLPTSEQKDVSVQLSVPTGFNSSGIKQGTLIFWAEVQN